MSALGIMGIVLFAVFFAVVAYFGMKQFFATVKTDNDDDDGAVL